MYCPRSTFIAALALTALVSSGAAIGTTRIARISTENIGTHFQAQALERFSAFLAERLGSSFRVEFYNEAKLFRDANAVGALAKGDLEVAAPGIWQLDRYVPDTAAFMLPSMYALPKKLVRAIVDGPLGDMISRKIEDTLGVVVIGPWLDLGYGNAFGVGQPIRTSADIRGKRIRVAGGRGNEERVRALGGIPMSIPFLDLPAYLERGLVDGVLTTYETVNSSGLDRYGIRTVLEDEEYYPFYVPLVSNNFWAGLSDPQRSVIRSSWAEVAAEARLQSERAQETAKARLVARGLVVFKPSPEDANAIREELIAQEDEIARRLNVSQEILELLRSEIRRLAKP